MLAKIAEDAQPEVKNYLAKVLSGLAAIGFMPSANNKITQQKAGTRAALMLVERNDPRCLAPLLRLYETEPFWQNKYQEQIETSLIDYLGTAGAEQPEAQQHVNAVRQFTEQLWKKSVGKRDISLARANLLLAALHFLQHQSSTAANATLLEMIRKEKIPNHTSRRFQVQKHILAALVG